MRWTRWIATTATILASIAAMLLISGAAPAKSGKPAAASATADKVVKAKQIERGEYLSAICGCNDCHTPGYFSGAPDYSRRLSGSEMGWRGPWGVTYARNLTPDLETGIGYWSEIEIENAIRAGMSADRGVLQPPMPWQDFARMSDEDVHALAVYLKSLPAIHHAVPDRVGPDQAKSVTGSILDFPPPTAWDAPRTPPAADGAGRDKK